MAAPADTIAAIATAHGRAGIGVVRVSGRSLGDFATALMGVVPPARRATRAVFRDAHGAVIDDGLALYFPAPRSYTGEDVLELQGHGGPLVLAMLLRRCFELGARLAEPGEFTRRAFLNDKLDLAQAEAVADVIDAATETAARCAVRSLRGEFSGAIHALVDQLVELRALAEATLDFPEEEIDPLHRADARGRLERLRAALDATLARAQQGACSARACTWCSPVSRTWANRASSTSLPAKRSRSSRRYPAPRAIRCGRRSRSKASR